jgi:nitric oxide dioxygenase
MSLQVEVLERSFTAVAPKGDEFVAAFYARLFSEHPEVKPLFGDTDMAVQQKKLLAALVLAVENLRRPDVLGPVLKDLGRRHAGYGAKPEHYGVVGAALLETFAVYLGAEWTPDVKQAWVEAYGAISSLMLEGANGHAV